MLVVIGHANLCFGLGIAGIHGGDTEEIIRHISQFPGAFIQDAVNNDRIDRTLDLKPEFFCILLGKCYPLEIEKD